MTAKPTPPSKTTPDKEDKSLTTLLGENKEENKPTAPEKKNDDKVILPIGPDSDKDDVIVPVDQGVDVDQEPTFDRDEDYDNNDDDPFISPEVVALRADKTPSELSSETPAETAKRYNIDNTITDEDADNPRVQAYRDTKVNQIPSGTHLHPDVAKDLLNRGIAEQHTENAQVKRTVTEHYDFAPDAEFNDKF